MAPTLRSTSCSAAMPRSARSPRPAVGSTRLLERYAVVVMADHGQTAVHEAVSLPGLVVGSRRRRPARVQPCRPPLSAARLPARSTRSRRPARRRCRGRGRPVPRGERRRRAPGRRGARLRAGRDGRVRAHGRCLDPRLPRCARSRVGGAREPERRRDPRLRRRGLRVRRPRRRAPRRRRLPRLARRGRHRGTAPDRRRRGLRRRASSTSRRSSSPISASPPRPTRSARREPNRPPLRGVVPLPSPNVIEPSPTTTGQGTAQRVGSALGRRSNWEQLAQVLRRRRSAATPSTSSSTRCCSGGRGSTTSRPRSGRSSSPWRTTTRWNRVWTFREQRGNVAYQGPAVPGRLDDRTRRRTSSCCTSSSRRGSARFPHRRSRSSS